MNIFTTFLLALRALWRHKVRTFLTMLGLIGGIGTVIAMVSAGQGARESVADVFRSMGTNLLIITNGSNRSGGVAGGAGSTFALTWDDVQALENGEVPSIKYVSPVLATKMQVAAEDTNWNTSVTGTNAAYFKIKNWDVVEGTRFDDDVPPGSKIALIGKTVATQLYPGVNPIGQQIRINGQPYEVTGVLATKGQSAMGQDQDDIVIVPLKTYMAKLDRGAGKYLTKGQIYVSTESENDISRAETQITELLRQKHNLGPNDEDDFRIRNLAEFALRQKESTDKITTLLAIVAAMALLVGGIGVMNIMLVSVIERTREIGIRMAVGAKPIDVMTQFLVEAILLSLIGGAIGLAAGAWGAKLMADYYGWKFLFPAQTAVIAFLISSGIGVVFGLYPAIRASLLDPITALRYET
ncbi:MAG TPA: ABC transporter permease [Kofleriaceae bacterium]|jgi:putative ABC transport system permease protein|nr:ABC transporter permease [Kofleriaceae bacterium]